MSLRILLSFFIFIFSVEMYNLLLLAGDIVTTISFVITILLRSLTIGLCSFCLFWVGDPSTPGP